MGYWRQGTDGSSLHCEETGLIWGDQPADVWEHSIREVIDVFYRDRKRLPTKEEMIGGLLFSLSLALKEAQEKHGKDSPIDTGIVVCDNGLLNV